MDSDLDLDAGRLPGIFPELVEDLVSVVLVLQPGVRAVEHVRAAEVMQPFLQPGLEPTHAGDCMDVAVLCVLHDLPVRDAPVNDEGIYPGVVVRPQQSDGFALPAPAIFQEPEDRLVLERDLLDDLDLLLFGDPDGGLLLDSVVLFPREVGKALDALAFLCILQERNQGIPGVLDVLWRLAFFGHVLDKGFEGVELDLVHLAGVLFEERLEPGVNR